MYTKVKLESMTLKELETAEFMIEMNDHWSWDDYKTIDQIHDEIRKRKLQEATE